MDLTCSGQVDKENTLHRTQLILNIARTVFNPQHYILYTSMYSVHRAVMLSTLFFYYYKEQSEFYKNITTSTVAIAFQVKVISMTLGGLFFQPIFIHENVCICNGCPTIDQQRFMTVYLFAYYWSYNWLIRFLKYFEYSVYWQIWQM